MDAYNLLDESFTTVAVTFYNDDEEDYSSKAKTYNYKVPKAWDIQVDTLLVVPATSTLRIVKVREVHEEPRFNGLPNLRWAVMAIDMTEHEALQARERMFRDALQKVERQKQKDALVHTLQTSAAGSAAASVLLGEALEMIGVSRMAPPMPPPFVPAPFVDAPGSFGDGPAHADDGHAGFTPPPVDF